MHRTENKIFIITYNKDLKHLIKNQISDKKTLYGKLVYTNLYKKENHPSSTVDYVNPKARLLFYVDANEDFRLVVKYRTALTLEKLNNIDLISEKLTHYDCIIKNEKVIHENPANGIFFYLSQDEIANSFNFPASMPRYVIEDPQRMIIKKKINKFVPDLELIQVNDETQHLKKYIAELTQNIEGMQEQIREMEKQIVEAQNTIDIQQQEKNALEQERVSMKENYDTILMLELSRFHTDDEFAFKQKQANLQQDYEQKLAQELAMMQQHYNKKLTQELTMMRQHYERKFTDEIAQLNNLVQSCYENSPDITNKLFHSYSIIPPLTEDTSIPTLNQPQDESCKKPEKYNSYYANPSVLYPTNSPQKKAKKDNQQLKFYRFVPNN